MIERITALLLLLGAQDPKVQETFPIYACISVPPGESTPERYRELADAGFAMSLTGFPNLAEAIKALDAARGTGVTLFITCPELKRDTVATVRKLAGHPALAGYHLQDEPSAADFPALAAWQKTIQGIDPAHPCYVNLNPIYAGPKHLGTDTYQEHVEQFVRIVQPPFISFDNYPTSFGKLDPKVFTNLEIISAAARGAGKPFWGFYQSVVWGKMPPRTLAHLRLESFGNLVYGAQCIQAFTYWMPGFPDHRDAPIGLDGKRTHVYDLVKRINGEIRAWSRVFKDAQVLDVSHAGPALPPGTRSFAAKLGVSGLDVGSGAAVVSFLKKGDGTFVALLNKDLQGTLALKIRFDDPGKVLDVRKDGVDRPVGGPEFILEPGDLQVFRLPFLEAGSPEQRVFSTLAGSRSGHADGRGVEARFASPEGIAVDSKGNVYVTEYANSTVRRISPDGGAVTLGGRPGASGWKDGPGGEALFSHPHGLAVSADLTVYVSDMKNHAIRRISPSGDVSTVAGKAGEPGTADGPGEAARFCQPEGVAVEADGTLYVADTYNFTVRKISRSGAVTTLAGKAGSPGDADGKGSEARFNMPLGVAVDGSGIVFVVDADYDGKPTGNCTVRRISPDGTVTTIAGQAGVSGAADGPGPAARFTKPVGIAATRNGTLYIADTGAHTIRRISPQGEVSTVGGAFRKQGSADGVASAARFHTPQAVAVGDDGTLYVADTFNHRIRKGVLQERR